MKCPPGSTKQATASLAQSLGAIVAMGPSTMGLQRGPLLRRHYLSDSTRPAMRSSIHGFLAP